MVRNNLKTVFRHLSRQKLNTALHIIGLAIGMTVCLLIALFIRYELSFDAYHEKADRTYRVISRWTETNGQTNTHYSTPFPLANAIRNEMSGIEQVSFAHPVYTKIVEVNPQKRFIDERIMAVEPEFKEIFEIETVKGDLNKTLRTPYQAALTETTAKKLFGEEEPLGKTFIFDSNGKFEFTVSALIKDFPANTHLPASMLVSHAYTENFLKANLDGWTYVSGTETLIVVSEDTDLSVLTTQLKAIADKHLNSNKDMPFRSDFELQPLKEVHFNNSVAGGGEWVQAISISWLWFFAVIGIAVLILACINFINLSTAQALTRAKEVGVRKSVGAGRFNLIVQFLSEAWILTLVSGILAVAIAELVLPSINTLLDKRIPSDLFNSMLLPSSLLIALLIGLLAGMYPAWVISKYNPSITLKAGSTTSGDHGSAWLRKGLVVTQFTVSIGLLMVVLLIAEQVEFLRNKNLGFTKDNIINVEIQPRLNKHHLFKNEMEKIVQVKDVSFATNTPSSPQHWGTRMNRVGREDQTRKEVTLIFGDDRFCKLYGLQLLAGRFLEASDTNYIAHSVAEKDQIMKAVVNEQLVRELEFNSNDEAIGERVWIGWNSGNVEIVGVVRDFNTSSLHQAIKPTIISPSPRDYQQAGIKIEANSNLPETLAAIEAAWKSIYPEGVFSYKFLDQQIDAFYKAEERLFSLFKIFSGLGMFISCLGLWGLATFAAQSRTKEIGIRKVLGASVNKIAILLSKDFLLLVLAAMIIATPIAWYGMNQWLQNYAFRIEVSWWVFGIAGTTALIIALLTVSTQAIKAARSNPVNSLRSE
ncbi:MAG TPA: ABC transporter permease [Cyclobacteriaceae bacterium]|nr:ABC transporter permease [Cyclobacteriaceae bacterium]HPW63100.1 ABC transporter permease [Cyclobacteriaceae bacterium]